MDSKNEKIAKNEFYPPVVAALGHVDHGKTTLLDAFRKTNVAAEEHGGITQKIGASEIEVDHEGKKRKITFIDTPGHEAFFQMRGRGVQAADIGILVVSSVDGVMPQTKESIALLKNSKIPFIVALTRSDDPSKLPDKAKQQLLKEGVNLEGYSGGDVPIIEVSGKTGHNVKELLDLILLVYELKREANFYPFSDRGAFMGIVIESKMDQKSGPRATVVVKNGKLKLREVIYSDDAKGKVRNLLSYMGKNLQEASVGEAVEVLGFEKVPKVGSVVSNTPKVIETLAYKEEVQEVKESISPFDVAEKKLLSIVLCADTQGSLEAITHSIAEDNVKFVVLKTGDIEVSDILFA